MKLPLVNLRAQHEELRAEIDSTIRQIIDCSDFIGGERVAAFEAKFAAFCGARHAVACASGTDALKLALMGTGIRPGDEVITSPFTFIGTTESMRLVGAYPTFVDVEPTTCNLSPDRLAEFLETRCKVDRQGQVINRATKRPIRAVMPVHLYGLPADMGAILDLAGRYRLPVIEDACQAHGAACRLDGESKRAGTLGRAAAFSFYPGKNLGAMGEGGAVTTDDDRMDHDMRIWRDHGQSQRYVHVSPDGWNGRLDALQCTILEVKLAKLDEWNERRRAAAARYRVRLDRLDGISLLAEPSDRIHAYHLFVVRLRDRDRVRQELSSRGIGVGLHYPIPLHLQPAYADLGCKPGDFPASEDAANSVLSLPMFPHLTEDEVDHVCCTLREVL